MKHLLQILLLFSVLPVCTPLQATQNNPTSFDVTSNADLLSQQVIDISKKIVASLNSQHTEWPDIDDELDFLRAFSYQHHTDRLTEPALTEVHIVLQTLSQYHGFVANHAKAKRWQEQYSVLSYRYQPTNASSLSERLNTLSQLTSKLPDADLASDYAWWEAIRAQAFLALEARSKEQWKQQFNQSKWQQVFLALVPKANDWQLEHLLWLLAYQHILMSEETQKSLDDAVIIALQAHPELSEQERKQLFSWRYLTNSFRVQDNCRQDFSNWCVLPPVEQALPHQHSCHTGLVVRYRSINTGQLQQLCQQMMAQEDDFHRLLQTGREPVANDGNQRLEVIVFDDYSDYNLFGALNFNIRTDNGGMFIEGTPSDPNNQARFFAFQKFWQPEPLDVWNLEHEYVHYLDGRYTSYGPFGHFPSHKVWWSEGLAELISLGKHNPQAITMLSKTAAEDTPELSRIFAASYQDGLDLTYRWSYLAWRFLQSELPELIPALAQTLRTDFFAGYQHQLTQIAQRHQADFSAFLQHLRNHAATEAARQPPILGRYLYRSYLQPAHLINDERHFHRFYLNNPSKD